MTKREQLEAMTSDELNDIMCEFYHNFEWQSDLLNELLCDEEIQCKFDGLIIDKICNEISTADLCESGWIEAA